MKWIEEANKGQEFFNEILSFSEYMSVFEKDPVAETRPTCVYFRDIFDYFGQDHKDAYKLFLGHSSNSSAVFGQRPVQSKIYQTLTNFGEEGFNNKFILLIGPNGSAKTSLIRKIMEAAEEYSKLEEGALYTFSWVFPIETYIKGTLGLAGKSGEGQLKTFAHLDDKNISSILPSELKDHPILLIPLEYRKKLIDEALCDFPDHYEIVKKSYIYNGDISKRNKMIFDALLKSYQGNYQEVLKHIRVERYIVSKRYSNSAVTVEPQLHVDLRMQQITMDKRLASLPPSLQSLNLFSLSGENIMANRGILEFSDLLKRPMDAYKYLLMTMESKTINLQGILTELDILFVGTSNEIHLAAFKQHPDYHSFRGRLSFIKVPYLLDIDDEMNIYREQIENVKDKSSFEPRSLEALCAWAVMTRLRPCVPKNYKDKRLSEIASGLGPLEKAILYTYKKLPLNMNTEDKKLLKSNINTVQGEFINENLYEGKFGISPREIKQILYELASKYKTITFVDILDFLYSFVERKNEHDFLNIAPQGDYTNPLRFIELLKVHELNNLDSHLRDSLGLIDDRSYEEYLARYIKNINSLIKGERIFNNITGRFEDVDMYFVNEFESKIKLSETADNFRSYMLTNLGAYSLDHPNEKIIYCNVFPDVVKELKESFREDQKKVIVNVAKNLVFYIEELEKGQSSGLSVDNRSEIELLMKNLQEKYHYSEIGALTLMKYLIKERY